MSDLTKKLHHIFETHKIQKNVRFSVNIKLYLTLESSTLNWFMQVCLLLFLYYLIRPSFLFTLLLEVLDQT